MMMSRGWYFTPVGLWPLIWNESIIDLREYHIISMYGLHMYYMRWIPILGEKNTEIGTRDLTRSFEGASSLICRRKNDELRWKLGRCYRNWIWRMVASTMDYPSVIKHGWEIPGFWMEVFRGKSLISMVHFQARHVWVPEGTWVNQQITGAAVEMVAQ